MTRFATLMTLSLAVGCAPQHVDQWAQVLNLPAVDVHDPQAQALAAEAWCAHGPALVGLVGPEVIDAMPPGELPACHPHGWVDLGHGVYGPPHLLDIRWCESGDDYAAVSPSGRYRGAWQALGSTWRAYAPDGWGDADPAAAPPWVQDTFAVTLYVEVGPGQWPVCSRRTR